MRIPIFQVDAFAERPFEGNPAAVCCLERWPSDALLQSIAAENNLSETAYLVPRGGDYELRWFTPRIEIDLCGHATLASAKVVFERLEPGRTSVTFHTESGPLEVVRAGDALRMDFPLRRSEPCPTPEGLAEALGIPALECRHSVRDLLILLGSEGEVRSLAPDFRALEALEPKGFLVTAPGDEVDFVSRFFAPRVGVPEDPVTGSAHCVSVPFWGERLGKTKLVARQLSERGGTVLGEVAGERVLLTGSAVLVLAGEFVLPQFSEK